MGPISEGSHYARLGGWLLTPSNSNLTKRIDGLVGVILYFRNQGRAMDIRKIRRLIELLKESDISELEITEGEQSIRLSRGQAEPSAPPPATPAMSPQEPSPSSAEQQARPAPPPEKELYTQYAPMVGTFYRSPSPEAEPYIHPGDWVNQGDILCVIEAMKLFNEIESEHAGRIKEVLVENAQPVEFGEALFTIDPEG